MTTTAGGGVAMATGPQPVKRSQVEVVYSKRNEAKMSVTAPAYATCNRHGSARMRRASRLRGGPDLPQRVQVVVDLAEQRLKLIPVAGPGNPDDDFAVVWQRDSRCTINLIEAYLQYGLSVPQDQVQEIPLSVESDPQFGWCLVGDLARATFRNIDRQPGRNRKAAARRAVAQSRLQGAPAAAGPAGQPTGRPAPAAGQEPSASAGPTGSDAQESQNSG